MIEVVHSQLLTFSSHSDDFGCKGSKYLFKSIWDLSSGVSIGATTGAAAPGPRCCQGPMKKEFKKKKNSCPELPQAPIFVNEIAGGRSVW